MFVGSTGGEKKLKGLLFSLSFSVLGMTVSNVPVGWLQDSHQHGLRALCCLNPCHQLDGLHCAGHSTALGREFLGICGDFEARVISVPEFTEFSLFSCPAPQLRGDNQQTLSGY